MRGIVGKVKVCKAKRAFDTAIEAIRFADNSGARKMKVYRCSICKHFHMSSGEQGSYLRFRK